MGLNCNPAPVKLLIVSQFHIMKNSIICLLLFTIVSCTTLFAMKYILWAMFKWGGIGAIGLALIFTCFYAGSFMAVKKSAWREQNVSSYALKWIWVLGFFQLGALGVLYHLTPKFFPAIIADFFFA